MKPLTILVDLDAICADLLTAWLSLYNSEWSDNLTVDDITTFDVEHHVKLEAKGSAYPIIEREGFFLTLRPVPGSQDTLEKWKKQGHRVVFCSSPPTAHGAGEKYQWINDNFGHAGFSCDDVILAKQKDLIFGDVLIDDYPENATSWGRRWPNGRTLTISYPYNVDSPAYNLIAGSCQEPEKAWNSIDKYIQTLAG